MSSAPAPKALPAKSKKEKDRDRREKQSPPSERLKTVVRRLPSNLPEEIFWQSVQPWVTDETVTWKVYHPGKLKKRLNKENIPSRAYIAFKSDEALAQFSRAYDGHMFRDKAGNESQAVVEFAPYQKVPSDRKKPDARNATIETDESYISFLESLNAPVNREPVSIESLMVSTRPPTPPKTTPLLEALKAEKSAQKDKEAILRNHAHYKDQVTIVNRKEEGKRKAGPPPKSAEPPVTAKKQGKKEKGPIQIAVPPSKAQQQQGSQPKNAAGPSGGNANATAVAQGNNKPPKPPKQPRAPRQAQQANNAAASHGNANGSAAAQPAGPAPSPATANETESTAPNTPTAAPSRRGRPILGLGGRHFEAALSGVGANVPPGERKSRRERQKEREASASVNGNATAVAATPAGGPNGSDPRSPVVNEKPARETPTTPKKERRRKDGGGDRVPTLLQRGEAAPAISILQRDMPRIDDVPAGQSDGPVTEATTNHVPPARGGGPRRGRSRGGRGSGANRGG